MSIESKAPGTDSDVRGIVLAAKLDLPGSEALAETLRSHRGNDIAIDASEVTHIGAHGVQTLLVGRATWAADGRDWRVGPLSEAVEGGLSTLGIDPEEIAGEAAQ